MTSCVAHSRDRTVLFAANPALWPAWPFLPVVRRSRGREELGVVFDSRAAGLTGFSAAVMICNLFSLPASFDEFLALPKEVFDSAEELSQAGWQVD